jgi:hypothetical protein
LRKALFYHFEPSIGVALALVRLLLLPVLVARCARQQGATRNPASYAKRGKAEAGEAYK